MKKRLLLVTNGFPFGESERGFLTVEVRHLADAFDLYVLALDKQEALRYPTDGIKRLERYAIPTFRKSISLGLLRELLQASTLRELYGCGKKNGFRHFSKTVTEIVYFRFRAWIAQKHIDTLVQAEHIDLVYTYWSTWPALAAVQLKKQFPNLRVVTRFHGMDLFEERTPINWQPFRREIVRGADGLCFACEYGRSYFQQHWGEGCAEKVKLCYLGSSDRGLMETKPADTLQLLSCSNLIPLKRVELIIEGLALLPKSVKAAWHIFGDGPLRDSLEALAVEKLRGCPNISWEFHGFVPNWQLAEEYRRLAPQLFITTSSTEGGAPASMQEVFSMGIPAIGTDVGGIPDLILDGQTGFLLPLQTQAADVAHAIGRFLALTEEQKLQMRANVRQRWTEKFDAERNAVCFTAYLQNLASGNEQTQ